MERIKVCEVLGGGSIGGVSSVVLSLLEKMDTARFSFDIVAAGESVILDAARLSHAGVRLFPAPKITRPLSYIRALTALFRAEKYDIVHVHLSTLSAPALFAARRAGIPVRIVHAHSAGDRREGARTLLKKILAPSASRFATERFACSHLSAAFQFGKRAERRGDVFVLTNGIDLQKFHPDAALSQKTREELGIADAYVLGHLGRTVKQKNPLFLLDVLAEAKKRRDNVKLLVVGDGAWRGRVLRKAEAMGLSPDLLFLPPTAEPWRYYAAMDAFLLPSFYEGLPLVGLEAQAMGLPTFCSANVTEEAAASDLACFLPLGNPALWADALFSGEKTPAPDLSGSIFDLSVTAKRLAEKYISLWEENRV